MRRILVFLILGSCISCSDISGVEISERSTFVKFFGTSNQEQAGDIIATSDGGYLIVGTSRSDTLDFGIVIKTDASGNTLWERILSGASFQSLLETNNGYILVGDSITPVGINENVNSTLLLMLDINGNTLNTRTYGDPDTEDPTDYHGISVTSDNDGNFYVLGTRENELDLDETILISLDPNLDIRWEQVYPLLDRSQLVSRSIFFTLQNHLIWSNTAFTIADDDFDDDLSIDSYLSIPVVALNQQNINNDNYGQNLPSNFSASDIHPGLSGFGLIGSTDMNGSNDILFLRVDNNGSIIPNSEITYGSSGDDQGISLSSTSDGGFILLGAFESTLDEGNGGSDIYLMKTDSRGNLQWESPVNIGGTGNEIGARIIEAPDGGYVILGTQDFQQFSMMTMIKVNSEGQLNE